MDTGILLVFFVVFLCSYYFKVRQKNLPPGPFCFPILGSVQIIRRVRQTRPHIALMEVGEKYGPVLSFKLGTARFVVLSGYEAIHEALVKRSDVLSDRPRGPIIKELLAKGSGKSGIPPFLPFNRSPHNAAFDEFKIYSCRKHCEKRRNCL